MKISLPGGAFFAFSVTMVESLIMMLAFDSNFISICNVSTLCGSVGGFVMSTI